jgi:hypothetical protein
MITRETADAVETRVDSAPTAEDLYQPPAVEAVLTGEELDREVQYAGFTVVEV